MHTSVRVCHHTSPSCFIKCCAEAACLHSSIICSPCCCLQLSSSSGSNSIANKCNVSDVNLKWSVLNPLQLDAALTQRSGSKSALFSAAFATTNTFQVHSLTVIELVSFNMKTCRSTWMSQSYAVKLKKLKHRDVFSWVVFMGLETPFLNIAVCQDSWDLCGMYTLFFGHTSESESKQSFVKKNPPKFTWEGRRGSSDKNQKPDNPSTVVSVPCFHFVWLHGY